MPVPTFRASVTDRGQLVPEARHDFDRWLRTLAGKRVDLIVREPRPQRSYRQLKYWFGVPMKLLSEVTGYTKMQMHYLCIAICFGVVVDPASGREVPVVAASRALTTKQFAELVEWCPAWSLETHGLEIPLPNDVDIDSLPGEAP